MPDNEAAAREDRRGRAAVIFAAWCTRVDNAGYAAAAAEMDALAAAQPSYRGVDAARGGDGFGITVSYWADEASVIAWCRHPAHATVREAGRGRWYYDDDLHVGHVSRSYGRRSAREEQA